MPKVTNNKKGRRRGGGFRGAVKGKTDLKNNELPQVGQTGTGGYVRGSGSLPQAKGGEGNTLSNIEVVNNLSSFQYCEVKGRSIKKGKAKTHFFDSKTKITPSLRSYFKVQPLVLDVLTQGEALRKRSKGQWESPPVLERMEVVGSPSLEGQTPPEVVAAISVLASSGLTAPIVYTPPNIALVTNKILPQETHLGCSAVPGKDGTEVHKVVDEQRISWTSGASLEALFSSLSVDIKRGFSVSEANQGEIQLFCESLDKKIDLLNSRAEVLEGSVEEIRDELGQLDQTSHCSREKRLLSEIDSRC